MAHQEKCTCEEEYMIGTSRIVVGIACACVASLASFFPSEASTKDLVVAPPAADETLIYVFRKFPGYGIWIAVNDQTVTPLKKNKRHAVVRAKAGLITLNAARQGFVIGAIAIDDRPGETVYVLVSSSGFVPKYSVAEISPDDAAKRMRKTKLEDSIEPLANNEYHGVLLNPGELGFNLMRLAGDALEPDANSAVITFFRRKEKKIVDKDIGIWGSEGFIGDLRNEEALSVRVVPGEHFFLAGRTSTSVLRAQVEAGKQYYVWQDVSLWTEGIKFMPIEGSMESELQEWLSTTTLLELNESALTPRVRERNDIVMSYVNETIAKAKSGGIGVADLGAAHAF
jgi:hypothetical protein